MMMLGGQEELKRLAQGRLADAEPLLEGANSAARMILAGYVIECALKACVAKLTVPESFLLEKPDICFPIINSVEVGPLEARQISSNAWIIDPEGNRIELWEPPK